MKRKLSVLLAALGIISATACPVMAAETLTLPDDGSIVQPRWNNISYIDVSLDKYGNIEGFVSLRVDYKYVVTVELREANGTIVETWEEENGDVITSCDLESGVRYYVRAIVKVYNDSGKVIETATKNSSTITAS